MNRINILFRNKKSDILSVYFTAGYPKPESTLPTIKALEAGGVDLLEIGIPFSDSMADGPTIQQSSKIALDQGMSLKLLFSQLKDVRKEVSIPLILMGYLNPILQFGFESFCEHCQSVGIDGLIIPDLPFNEYIEDYKLVADKYNIKIIMLITPATSESRIRLIDQNTDGFIYVVSSTAVTGSQDKFGDPLQDYFKRVDAMGLKNSRLIGFGISNAQTREAANRNAQGVIVGSKFIQLLGQEASPEKAVRRLKQDLGV